MTSKETIVNFDDDEDEIIEEINDGIIKEIDVKEIDKDKLHGGNSINSILGKPNNGNPISMIEMSQTGKYLVTYSKVDGLIVEWEIEDVDVSLPNVKKGVENTKEGDNGKDVDDDRKDDRKKCKYNQISKVSGVFSIVRMCVSDQNILAYIDDYDMKIIDMNNPDHQEIKLYFKFDSMSVLSCNFNLKGDLILYCTARTNIKCENINIICVYSIQIDTKTTECQNIYTVPKKAEVLSITNFDTIWLRLKDHIYEWNLRDDRTTIVSNNIPGTQTKNIKIYNNESYTCLGMYDIIIVHSNEMGFPIATFDIDDLDNSDKGVNLIYEFMKLYPSASCLLLSLLKHTQYNHFDRLIENETNKENENPLILFYSLKSKNYMFEIVNDNIKVDELKFKKELKVKVSKGPQDIFGRYLLEKHSIIWKIKIEEFKKLKRKGEINDAKKKKEGVKDQVNEMKKLHEKIKESEGIKKIEKNFELIIKIEELKKWKTEIKNFVDNFKNSMKEEEIIAKIDELNNNLKQKEQKSEVETSANIFIQSIIDIKENAPKKRIEKIKSLVVALIKDIEKDKITKLEESLKKLAKRFIKDKVSSNIDEMNKFVEDMNKSQIKDNANELFKNFIKNLNKNKPSEFINEEEGVDEFINVEVDKFIKKKIEKELAKDFIERLNKIEESEKDKGRLKYKIEELAKDFAVRIIELENLAKDLGKLKIKILKETKLYAEKNLVSLLVDNEEDDDVKRDYVIDDDGVYRKKIDIIVGKLLNNNDIVILTDDGIFIFHLNKDWELMSYLNKGENLISLKYFYSISQPKKIIKKFGAKDFVDDLIYGWASYVNRDNKNFIKYGAELLMFAIELHDLKLIDEIYKKCLKIFEQDPENHKAVLSIITKSMPLLNKFYPEYVRNYSSDTRMIVDVYKTKNLSMISHLYPVSNIGIVDITRSIFWTKYARKVDDLYYYSYKRIRFLMKIYFIIENLIFLLTFPISFPILYILDYFHIINEIYADGLSKCYYKCCYQFRSLISKLIYRIFPEKTTSKNTFITFMNPYIKFVNYPSKWSWWELIKPQPSPFVETITLDIYSTFNGESLINFKWDLYGKYYYVLIWVIFAALLGCFTAATLISKDSILISEDTRNLLIASIILAFIHLSNEVRQFIYSPGKWVRDPWNYFDLGAYLITIITSIFWLYDEKITFLVSISCLLLELKFLLFLRAFESFGSYFIIMAHVAKKIFSFLVVLLIILLSFAHAFWVLLKPRQDYSLDDPVTNDDPNNPWSLTSSYNQILENGEFTSKIIFVQKPDKNTNMFTSYATSLFAMYLYLIGDSSALSNWEYRDNVPLVALMIVFSLLIALYLMNLLIGLLNMHIEKDNRASYLKKKAKILAEIELFYLLPNQRRWKSWFPDVIYYYANVDMTRKRIKELIKTDEWDSDKHKEMKKKLLKILNIQDSDQELKYVLDELKILKKQLDDFDIPKKKSDKIKD